MSLPIAGLDSRLAATSSLGERLRLIRSAVAGRVAFSTSLGIEDQAILDAIVESGIEVGVFTIDTGRHFPETLDTLDATEQRYGLRIRIVAPEAADVEALVASDGVNGFRRSIEARKACCDVRKVRPLERALRGAAGWITGIRREQAASRAAMSFVEQDQRLGLIKFNPIADWSHADVERYLAARDVPVSALHARGYPSIGCQPCTRAIEPGEDIRAGRWWWEQADGKECGLHSPRRPVGASA